ncbi:hypothetical protein L208DRAFT_196997 [Tricholoma matsutake]|nr:hypothetical protein L208DRAFT_196997 [Tricholoma matsutake 945]
MICSSHSRVLSSFYGLTVNSRRALSTGFTRFQWEDPLNIESLLTEEEIFVRDTARAYCQARSFASCEAHIYNITPVEPGETSSSCAGRMEDRRWVLIRL